MGAGPAGMFAALKLLMLGRKPVILERGKDVHARKFDMARLSQSGVVNPESNYCYGEGGAGAFSDGKLYTRSSKRGDIREVLQQLVNFGASKDVLIDAHPHIGSDKLPVVVENIRKCIIAHGGEYHFESKVVSIDGEAGDFKVSCADGKTYSGKAVILATGHSARDIYEMLAARGGALEAKGFAMGVRVEHPQEKINWSQYHGTWKPGVPAAEYSFVEQQDGRGVFSFCMCPGGILVPSSTEAGTVVLRFGVPPDGFPAFGGEEDVRLLRAVQSGECHDGPGPAHGGFLPGQAQQEDARDFLSSGSNIRASA